MPFVQDKDSRHRAIYFYLFVRKSYDPVPVYLMTDQVREFSQ